MLSLAERTQQVSVAGQVLKPGTYEMALGGGVVEAVALAGGVTPKASLREVVIKRADGTSVAVDLFDSMVHGKLAGCPALRAATWWWC